MWLNMERRSLFTVIVISVCAGLAPPAMATDVSLVGVAENTAILVIDGGRPKMMRVGQTGPAGVKLLAVTGDEAIVDVDGEQVELRLGDQPYAPSRMSLRSVVEARYPRPRPRRGCWVLCPIWW